MVYRDKRRKRQLYRRSHSESSGIGNTQSGNSKVGGGGKKREGRDRGRVRKESEGEGGIV